MDAHLTVVTENQTVLGLVADYAHGLGCAVTRLPSSEGGGVRVELPDASIALLEVLTQVALSATKADIDLAEPPCRVTYRYARASSEVTLGLRIAELRIDSVSTSLP